MKTISVYLHQEVLDTLLCFGNINAVVNKVIKDVLSMPDFDYNISKSPRRTPSCKRINIHINDELYEELGDVKVRPLLYWFVENEVYSVLGWNVIEPYGNKRNRRIANQFNKTLQELNKLNVLCNDRFSNIISEISEASKEYETQ